MSLRRRMIVVGLSLFVLAGIGFSLVRTTWSSQLLNPASQPTGQVAFTCGPLWGPNSVSTPRRSLPAGAPANTLYTVIGTPCSTRSQDQIMVGVDIVLGLLGIVVVVRWGREKVARPFTPNL